MEALQISQATSQGLSSLNALSKPALGSICKYFLQMVVSGHSSVTIDDELDEQLCVVSTVLLEAAKTQASVEQIRSTFNEHGVDADVGNALSELYSQHRDTLIQHMLATGIAVPSIVDINWRLDYNIKDRGIIRSIDMIANQEELQDLFNRVRDAVKQVERVLNTGDASSSAN